MDPTTPPPYNPFGAQPEPAPATTPQPAPAPVAEPAAELPAMTVNGVQVPARSTTDDTPEPQEPTR